MVISRKKAFIFFAFNKTGSSSIENVLRAYQSPVIYHWVRLRYGMSRNDSHAVFKHIRPIDCCKIIGRRQWDRYFKFCFVRNPFDRLVSLYFYHKQSLAREHPAATRLTFEQWILDGGSGSARRAMSEFVGDGTGNRVVDFVGRYETLEQDFSIICRELAIEATLPHVNRSQHTHYSKYYTERARREVERRFARDLEMFDYRFEDC